MNMPDTLSFSSGGDFERYRQWMDNFPDAVALHCDGEIVFVNAQMAQLFGAASASDLLGQVLINLLPADLQTALHSNLPLSFTEYTLNRLDGLPLALAVATMPLTISGKPAMQLIAHDLTEQKQAEVLQDAVYRIAQAADRAENLEQLYAAVHEIICTAMPARNFYIALYDEAQKSISFPYTVDEADEDYPQVVPLGKGLTEYVIRSGKPLFCDVATKERLLASGEIELVGTPSPIWMGVPLIVDDKTIGVMAVQHYHDAQAYTQRDLRLLEFVSRQVAMAIKRKQTEEALRESEGRFRSLFENATIGLYRTLPDGRILMANPTLVKMLGYDSFDEMAQLNLEEGENAETRRAFRLALEARDQLLGWEAVWKKRDGTPIHVRESARVVRLPDGQALYYEGTVEDITQRKQMELALQKSEENYRTLFEHVPDGIYRSSLDGQLLAVNPAFADMLGYPSPSAIIEKNWQDLYADPRTYPPVQAALSSQGYLRGYEIVLRRLDGRELTCLNHARAVYGDDGQIAYFEGVITDVSEQKQAEQALWRRIQALQSLAEIDRAILHTSRPEEISELVCRSAAMLLDAPKALLLSMHDEKFHLDAHFGLKDVVSMMTEVEGLKEGKLFRQDFDAVAFGSLEDAPIWMPEFKEREEIAALVMAPFGVNSMNIKGVLMVFDTRKREWGSEQADLLKLLAGQAAIGLEKVHLFSDLEKRADEFSVLYDIALDLTNQHEIDSLLKSILDHAMRLLDVPSASLFLYDSSVDALELSLFVGADVKPGLRMKMGEGLAGQVALTRRPMILEDYSSWEYRSEKWKDVPFGPTLQVPMLYGGELIGVLAVSMLGAVERRFTEEDMHLLYLFAGQAAGAIYNMRLFTEIRRANRELERLYHATGTLIASISLDVATLAQTIASTVVSDFQHANCSLWLLDEETKELKRLALAGTFSGQMRLNKLYLHGSGIIPRTVRTGQISNVPNVLEDPDYKVGWLAARSELCVPLEVNGRVIGALDLQSANLAAFDAADERLMFMFASRAGLMLEHARLLEQTERRLQRLTALRTIETAIASSLELSVTLNVLLEQITVQLKVDAAAVLLLDPHLQTLEYAAGRGFLGRGIERTYLRMGEDYAGKAVLEQTLIGVIDLNEPGAAPARPERIAGERFVTYYAVPLLAKGQVRGVLELYYRKRFEADSEWPDFLETLARQAAVAIDDSYMFTQLQRSYTDLIVAYDTSIEVWSRALDLREREPAGHAQRLTDLCLRLAREMELDESLLPHIYRGALLHDIGQLSIPDSILLKPGPLTEEEWKIMREHPRRAYEMLFPVVYLHPALNIPYCHHERWDGSGYPRGLKGEEIPIEARIFAVVDTWDALCTDRPQRLAWSEKDALRYIREQAGKQFDPAVVDAFLRVIEDFRQT